MNWIQETWKLVLMQKKLQQLKIGKLKKYF